MRFDWIGGGLVGLGITLIAMGIIGALLKAMGR